MLQINCISYHLGIIIHYIMYYYNCSSLQLALSGDYVILSSVYSFNTDVNARDSWNLILVVDAIS